MAAGTPFWTWVFVPVKLLDFQLSKTLRVYESTPDEVQRQFCSECGCHVSFACREEMWDISAAMLEQCRMEDWVSFSLRADEDDEDVDPLLGSFPRDGERYNPMLLAEVRKGLSRSGRF